MRAKLLLATTTAVVLTTASSALAAIDGPVLFDYRHSMQALGSSELGLPPHRESHQTRCGFGVPRHRCDAQARSTEQLLR